MKIDRFEDVIAWQKAQILAKAIHQEFFELRDWEFKNQILRAVVSISNNIAEGFDRETDKEFIRYLYYAKGSCSEVKSMIYTGLNFGYISPKRGEYFKNSCNEISWIIRGLMKSLSPK